jgi:streptogramin lyase
MKIKLFGIFICTMLIAIALPTEGNLKIIDNTPSISRLNRVWEIVDTYPIPEGAAGLAFDGTYLYCGIYGVDGDHIYQINRNNGNYQLEFTGPQEDAYGLTYDGNYLWTTDHPGSSSSPAVAMKLDWNGNLIDDFDLPDHYMSGIAYDDGDFWVATYYPDPATIYLVDDSGSVLDQFTAPNDQPWDLTMENDNLWMADYWGDTLYKIDPATGDLLDSHASEGEDPAGIVWDGLYLWYCDNGINYDYDHLYKVFIGGEDFPEINVPVTNYDYGDVAVDDSLTWDVTIKNIGVADLIIDDVTFSGAGADYLICPNIFPIAIPGSEQTEISIIYTPVEISELDAIATIESNDPINPDLDLTLSGNAIGHRPSAPSIDGKTNGDIGVEYEYTFVSTDEDDDVLYYWIEWGDGIIEEWVGPHASGADVKIKHSWVEQGTYDIKAQSRDDDGFVSPWGTLTVTMPRNRALYNCNSIRFLEKFPLLLRFLQNLGL